MPAKIFYPSAEKLKYMLDGIHHQDVALPDFQRDFVWEPRATEELIESICPNYPAVAYYGLEMPVDFTSCHASLQVPRL